MTSAVDRELAGSVRAAALPLQGQSTDFDAVLALVGDARVVLLGEATHGTHEFYRIRAELTKRLIRDKSFAAVAVEADWPDAYRVNRYVRGTGSDPDAAEALGGFRRFPQWMWRNADVLDFVGWLRRHNDSVAPRFRTGFYGLDLFSLHASMDAVLRWLNVVDPAAAARARERYACFELFGPDPRTYGRLTTLGMAASCEHEVIEQLVELQQAAGRLAGRDGDTVADDVFFARQNARLVHSAERYYRALFGDYATSWNLRDRHMMDTLDALLAHLGESTPRPRVVVWAHNSHVGDARATEMAERGEINLGQVAREQLGRDVVSIGFTTYAGTVTAARDWDETAARMTLRPALERSYEAIMHGAGLPSFFLPLHAGSDAVAGLRTPRFERAVGVVYRTATERQSHYFAARLPYQFDGLFHLDQTRAVEPLEHRGEVTAAELPATYPVAL